MYWVFEPNMLQKALRAYCLEQNKDPEVEEVILDFLRSEQAKEHGLTQGDGGGIKVGNV